MAGRRWQDSRMSKASLRRSLAERRRGMAAVPAEPAELEHRILAALDLLRVPAAGLDPRPIAVFAPTATEPDIGAALDTLRSRAERLIFPVFSGGPSLDWRGLDVSGALSGLVPSPGAGFGSEPAGQNLGSDALARVKAVLAPAVAVDRSGTRLGHGRGYYDRALVHLAPLAPVIAVVHPWELLPARTIPREEHDISVDAVVTRVAALVLRPS